MNVSLPSLDNKRILVTSGRTIENIDGVRCYANLRRPAYQGHAAAAFLSDHGAAVSLITPTDCGPCLAQNILVRPGPLNTDDSIPDIRRFLAQHPCDALLCLACLPSIRPEQTTNQKLKIKEGDGTPVSFIVRGTADIKEKVKDLGLPVLGFDTGQQPFAAGNIPSWLDAYAPFVLDAAPLLSTPEPDPFPVLSSAPPLAGKTVILTSGPTVETLTTAGDVITNASSGRQGAALASALAQHGVLVEFVVGNAEVLPPGHPNIHVTKVLSAHAMLDACLNLLPADMFIGVAAVADFGCETPIDLPLHENESHTLTLRQNPDILKAIATHATQRPRLVVGFAAETDPETLLDYASKKGIDKNADLICANLVGPANSLDKTENRLFLVSRNAPPIPLGVRSKRQAAEALVDALAQALL
ncbi:MAG: phosphopantothenoylcysteine decarboxylase [Alphaproteobacteria bacterium]|nr:phosphopantothenoylcysteine decarboxylase [Alphaproteobacteria bacterium]